MTTKKTLEELLDSIPPEVEERVQKEMLAMLPEEERLEIEREMNKDK